MTYIKGHSHSEEVKRKISESKKKSIEFNCDMCGKSSSDKPSSYARKKRHFCSRDCYSEFRATKMPFYEQHAYKGVRAKDETRQVYHRRYCKSAPDNIAHLKARRYAREKGSSGSHSLLEWESLKDSYGNCCAFCKSDDPLTKDHIIPLSKGGTDYIENIQPLCKSCNSKKGDRIQHPHLLTDDK